MFRALALPIQVSFAISCNHFIYFLQHLPWVGKKIPGRVYRIPTAKLILSMAFELIKMLFGFLGALLTLAILVFGPMYAIEGSPANVDLFYQLLFFVFFLIIPFGTNIIFQTRDMTAYTMVNILNLNKRDFFVSRVIYILAIKTARYAVLLMFSTLFIDISLPESLVLSSYVLFTGLIWEYGFLKIYRRFKFNLYEKTGPVFILLLFLLAACYLLPYRGIILNLRPILNSVYLFSLLFVLAGLSSWRLYTYDSYSAVTKKTIRREKLLEMEDLLKNAAFADVNLAEKKLAREKVAGAEHLQGYALFNHLFFARHRRIITKPVRIKVVFLAMLTVVAWGLLLVKPEFRGPVRDNILSLSPYLMFIMYMLSNGDKFSRALFFNCDRYMLKEHYYRDKDALLKNFTARLKKSINLNLQPAAVVAVMVMGTGMITGMGGQIVRLLPIIATVFTLSLFFSTHYLFIYYILQPFTAELTRKRPLYGLVNWLLYMISFGCVYIKTTSVVFTCAVIFLTLAYTAAAVLLTRALAPSTFKLR